MSEPASYVGFLRDRVGGQTVLLAYATALIHDGRGSVLFQHRRDFDVWGLPGGILELGESAREGLAREVREETGYTVTSGRFIGLYTSPEFLVVYPNGHRVQQVTACFECRVDPDGRHADGEESLAQEFRPLEEAPPLFPWYEQMLRDWQRPEDAGTRFDAGAPLALNPHREGYVRWLRARVGHDPILMPAACAVVRDEHGRILLHRRADSGLWGLPAGGMEIGERIDHTAAREVEEETGLKVRPVRLGGFYSGRGQWNVYPNGDQVWLAVACFLCEVTGGALHADGVESLDVGFFDIDRMPFDGNPWGERTLRRIHDAIHGGPEAAAD